MTPILHDCALGSDLDCQNFDLLNIRTIYPVPPALVASDDPRLKDPRVPPAASVTNESVEPFTGIEQSKLSLNGVIPTPWLGTGSDQAAQGDLVELASRKGAANGYAAVDSNAQLPASSVTTTANPGKVSRVALSMPPEFSVSSPITAAGGVLAVSWNNIPDQSWMVVNGPLEFETTLRPSFKTDPVPLEIVPDLSAAKFTTGVFSADQIPVAVGMDDVAHATGILPDPGDLGGPNEYLGRDMQWHHFQADLAYQPIVPPPNIRFNQTKGAIDVVAGSVTIVNMFPGSTVFYKVDSPEDITPFIASHPSTPGGSVTVPIKAKDTVYAYSAKAGYNNSEIVSFTVNEFGDITATSPTI